MEKEISSMKVFYERMISDIKLHTQIKIVEAKHFCGKRILAEKGKLESVYGKQFVKQIAEDLDTQPRRIWECIQFAEKYPDLSYPELCDSDAQLRSWHYINHNLLSDPKKKKSPQNQQDSNSLSDDTKLSLSSNLIIKVVSDLREESNSANHNEKMIIYHKICGIAEIILPNTSSEFGFVQKYVGETKLKMGIELKINPYLSLQHFDNTYSTKIINRKEKRNVINY